MCILDVFLPLLWKKKCYGRKIAQNQKKLTSAWKQRCRILTLTLNFKKQKPRGSRTFLSPESCLQSSPTTSTRKMKPWTKILPNTHCCSLSLLLRVHGLISNLTNWFKSKCKRRFERWEEICILHYFHMNASFEVSRVVGGLFLRHKRDKMFVNLRWHTLRIVCAIRISLKLISDFRSLLKQQHKNKTECVCFLCRGLKTIDGALYFTNYLEIVFDLYVLVTTANSPDIM